MMPDDLFDELYALADFCVRENYVLRSFLKYLLEGQDSDAAKKARLEGWRSEVATSLGNPLTSNRAESVLNTIRNLPPEEQKRALEVLLSKMTTFYFGA
jgi:hypothetical protein